MEIEALSFILKVVTECKGLGSKIGVCSDCMEALSIVKKSWDRDAAKDHSLSLLEVHFIHIEVLI